MDMVPKKQCNDLPPQSLTAKAPEKLPSNPIGKDRLPFPPFFRGELLNFLGVVIFKRKALNHRKRRTRIWHACVNLDVSSLKTTKSFREVAFQKEKRRTN